MDLTGDILFCNDLSHINVLTWEHLRAVFGVPLGVIGFLDKDVRYWQGKSINVKLTCVRPAPYFRQDGY